MYLGNLQTMTKQFMLFFFYILKTFLQPFFQGALTWDRYNARVALLFRYISNLSSVNQIFG